MFSSSFSPPAITYLCWKVASLTECRWMIICAQCKYQVGISKIEGILRKLVNPHKNTDKFVLHLIHIKKAFRMTEQADI